MCLLYILYMTVHPVPLSVYAQARLNIRVPARLIVHVPARLLVHVPARLLVRVTARLVGFERGTSKLPWKSLKHSGHF